MKLFPYLMAALASWSAYGAEPVDCSTVGLKAGSEYNCSSTVAERRFLLYIPSTLKPNTRAPLVLSLHGGGATPESFNDVTGMRQHAERRGFILVAPAGIDSTWNAGSCCASAAQGNVNDVGFLESVLNQVESFISVDSRRVFVIGLSNGAMMAHRVGCELSHRISAIAPVAGGMQNFDPTQKKHYYACRPRRALSVIEINGKPATGHRLVGVDSCAPFDGGVTSRPGAQTTYRRSIQESFDFWKNSQRCGSSAKQKVFGTGAGRFECSEYDRCLGGAVTALCTIPNGAHWWPGSEVGQPGFVRAVCGRGVESKVSASEVILDFLFAHPSP